MKRLLYLFSMIILCSSCYHKDLCYHHPHSMVLSVEFDWRDAPDADPDGMCVYFYPVGGGAGHRFDFNNTDGGQIELRNGRYLVLCYNNDTESVQFYNTDDFWSHGIYTREGSVLEPMYGNTVNSAPRADGTEDERVVISPDMMWGCAVTEVEISDAGANYTCVPISEDPDTMNDDYTRTESQVITLYPHELVCTYTYEVRNVKNLKHLSMISGTLSGMAGTLEFSSEDIGDECVTLPFPGTSDGVSKVTGMFYTFGHNTDNPDPHRMTFYAVMDNGEKFCFKDGDYLDVTDQVHNAPDFRHVHIIIDGLELPQPMENGSGFDPSVDDWEVVESDIIL